MDRIMLPCWKSIRLEWKIAMKTKTKHRKSGKWKRKADSSPVAKGRKVKRNGVRNPLKRKHLGGKGL